MAKKVEAKTNGGKRGPMMKAYLARSESGWVEGLGEGRVRIASIPMAGPYNLDDVIQVDVEEAREKPEDVLPGTVIHRKYPVRAAIFYDEAEQYKELWELSKKLGAALEGMVGPTSGAQGFAMVAALKEEDVVSLVEAIGSQQPEGWEPNVL